jgi:adenosylcobinamide-GDP ribazoletransferase
MVVLLLKTGIFSELLGASRLDSERGKSIVVLLTLIPVYSRVGLGLLMYFPFARKDGLAHALGGSRAPGGRFVLLAAYAIAGVPFVFFGSPVAGALFFCLYGFYCIEVFGGVTGDLMGAFVELSETLMLLTLVAAK